MWWRGTTPCTASLPPRPRRRRSGSSASSECLEERSTWGTVLGRAQQGPVLQGDSASQGILQGWGKKTSQVYKGTCPGPGRAGGTRHCSSLADAALVPLQGSHQPGPLLRDAGCQEEEGLLHQEALAARLALRGPAAAQVSPCHGGMWGRGHTAGWPSRPRAQLQLSHFFTVGGGKGHLSDSGPPSLPHRWTASSWAQAGTRSPGLSTVGTLPASDPQESRSHKALGPPSSRVLTLLGCSLKRGSSCGGFGVSQVLGYRVSAPGGLCRDTAPGPRCSGPGSDLASPRCCLGPSQPTPPWNGPHRQEGRGQGLLMSSGATQSRAVPSPSRGSCGSAGCHCPSTSLCHGPGARVAWCHGGTCPELKPALSVAAGGDLGGICLTIACVLSCPHPHTRSGGAWISISLFIRGVNTPV